MLQPASHARALAAPALLPTAPAAHGPKRQGGRQKKHGASAAVIAATTAAAVAVKRKRVRRLTPKQLEDAKARQNSDSRLYNLVLDVNDLKQHIRDLMVQKTLLRTQCFLTTLDGTGSSLKTTREFFVVCSGFAPGNRKPLAFIQAVSDPDFTLGTTKFGIEMFFAQWVRYNESFNSHGFTLGATTVLVSDSASCIVQTFCMFHGRISRSTLVKLFPAALANEALVAKLVGREIHFPLKILLHFSNRLLLRLDVDSDIIAGFSALLNNNPFEVAALTSNAEIQHGSMIGDMERVEELMDDMALGSQATPRDDSDAMDAEDASTVAAAGVDRVEAGGVPADRHSLGYLLS